MRTYLVSIVDRLPSRCVQLAKLVAPRRFRLPQNGDRLYTTDPDETERVRIQGYVDEGVGAYVAPVSRDGTVPLIR
jgi:hypothetical protein